LNHISQKNVGEIYCLSLLRTTISFTNIQMGYQ